MQQLLMLHRNPARRRHRRLRLNASAARRRHQPGAIIPQRRRPVRMPDHARQFLDISRKAIGPIRYPLAIHPSSSA
jgi:hypothetical protein